MLLRFREIRNRQDKTRVGWVGLRDVPQSIYGLRGMQLWQRKVQAKDLDPRLANQGGGRGFLGAEPLGIRVLESGRL